MDSQKKSNIINIGENTPSPFAVNTTLYIDAIKNNEKLQFTSEIIGWVRPQYLLTTASYGSSIMLLPVNTPIVARYLLEGQIYGFESKLIYKQTQPLSLWFIKYPSQIEAVNLRVSTRYPIVFEIKDQDGNTCVSKDISCGGAMVSYKINNTVAKKKMGDIIQLNFKLPDGFLIKGLESEVVRVYNDKDNQVLGVKFLNDKPVEISKVCSFIDKIKQFI